MPYLTKAQVEYLHNAWNKSSGIDRLQDTITRVQAELTTKNEELEQAQLDLAQASATINGLESNNQTLSAVNTQQAATITELTNQLQRANENRMPNHFVTVQQDQTVYGNCIVFMSFPPSTNTFNVATVHGASGNNQIDYPGNYCPYICIVHPVSDQQLYHVFIATTGGVTSQEIPGSRLSINYSINNQNILLLNRTD